MEEELEVRQVANCARTKGSLSMPLSRNREGLECPVSALGICSAGWCVTARIRPESATGIIHMNGRIYDPTLGRMLQADPFIQAPRNTQSYNRYSYVMNNPLGYTDPSGYFSLKYAFSFLSGVPLIYNVIQALPYQVVQAVGAVGSAFCGWGAPACYAGATAINSHAHGATVKDSLSNGAISGVSYWAFTPATVGTPTAGDFAIQAGIGAVAAENPQVGQALSLMYGSWGEPGNFAQNLAGNSLNYGASYAVGEWAEDHGITLQQFNLFLALNSKVGKWAAGSTFDRKRSFVGGWFSRKDGEIFGDDSAIGWALFDLPDTVLNAQGLLDAVSIDAVENGSGGPLTGHSLGAARVNNLYRSGYISGATLKSLPAFAYPAAGARGNCGNLDPVCGGALFAAFQVGIQAQKSPSWWNMVENHSWDTYR